MNNTTLTAEVIEALQNCGVVRIGTTPAMGLDMSITRQRNGKGFTWQVATAPLISHAANLTERQANAKFDYWMTHR